MTGEASAPDQDTGREMRRGYAMPTGSRTPPFPSPFARPDGSCLGHRPEEPDEEPVPAAPAGPEEKPADPAAPMNPG